MIPTKQITKLFLWTLSEKTSKFFFRYVKKPCVLNFVHFVWKKIHWENEFQLQFSKSTKKSKSLNFIKSHGIILFSFHLVGLAFLFPFTLLLVVSCQTWIRSRRHKLNFPLDIITKILHNIIEQYTKKHENIFYKGRKYEHWT